jgi:hypothetical protein
MIENEELFNERQFMQLGQILQSELILRHCFGVEERIRNAQSKEEAERYINAACEKFANECASGIVRAALKQHMQTKVSQYWILV